MRITAYLSMLLIAFLLSGPAQAADCAGGRGELHRQLWDGYTLQVGPAQGDHVNECFAAVIAPDGKTLFEVSGADATMLQITGRDVNGDGKPDVVLLTHAANSPENVYSIVGTAEPAGLIRQIVTAATLSFEGRGEDGRTEIVTRDTAFRGFDGLPADKTPKPLIFLRLKGKDIHNVSQVYWPEYEREIALARGRLGKKDMELFTDDGGNLPKPDKPKELSPQEWEHLQEIKGVVLEIALDYLYGGRGQEAWKTISEMWPLADRQRIRQEILRARMGGVMRDINRTQAKQASAH